MTNEELAIAIRNGNGSLAETLWKQVKGFVWKQAKRWALAWQGRKDFDIEDLVQSGYIAMIEAVQGFEPQSGSFLTLLNFCLLTEFSKVVGCRTKAQLQEPLNEAYSLDEPIKGKEDSDQFRTLADTIETEEPGFEAIEEDDFRTHLAKAVRDAVAALPDQQRRTIEAHFLNGQSYKEIAEVLNVSQSRIGQVSKDGIKALRSGQHAPELSYYLYGDRNYYRRTGFTAWKQTRSSAVEREVEYRENQRAWLKYLVLQKGMKMEEASRYIYEHRSAGN